MGAGPQLYRQWILTGRRRDRIYHDPHSNQWQGPLQSSDRSSSESSSNLFPICPPNGDLIRLYLLTRDHPCHHCRAYLIPRLEPRDFSRPSSGATSGAFTPP